jgi:endonuclease/exonuclease/phosphatase (EEP) superfamily protein YafD
MKHLFFLSALLFALPLPSEAARRGLAAQFSLIPESQAHLAFGESGANALDPSSIKVLVWNIKKGQQAGLDHDLPEYGKDRDLLVISEGYLNPLVRGIFDSFSGMHWDMGISFLYKKDHNYQTGTLIGSRVTPAWSKIKQTVDHEPVIDTPKCLTFGKYPIAGSSKQLLVISVHGINAVLPDAFERHMALAQAEIVRHEGPVLLAGDFNSNLSAKIAFLFKMTRGLGMQSLKFRNDERIKTLGQTIDYIFVRGLHVRDSEVLGSLTSSDHKAMLADLVVD